MLAQHSDEEVIARCRAGDLEAFGWLYARYARQVYRFSYHMLGDADDADDVKQDTFLKAYQAMPGFRGECSLQTWLIKIAGNLCRDRLKSRARRSELALIPEIADSLHDTRTLGVDPAATLERKDLHDTVHRVLGGLPEPQRLLIVLRDIEGLNYQQIADVLGCSVSSVKLRLFRARRGFRDRIESLLKVR
ncbi:MAG TPA: sigma-70 family RNA polymerase sigma factor [Chthonomonadaceae bacterium]|nr:sigma-70 family RNA polymerase sigma factor [Chthonomonadaceae bacterium]